MQYVQCLMAWSTSITLAKRLQTATKEAATGRWCYIISVLGLRHDARRNGFTSRNLTTGDVLTGLAEVKVGKAYDYNGEHLNTIAAGKLPWRPVSQ
jgi:adenylosuccinate synthase